MNYLYRIMGGSKIKGHIGEEKAKIIINRGKESERTDDSILAKINNFFIDENQYVINNFIVQHKNGQTAQIDHIIINNNGVFVIETKNYSGYIYGDDRGEQWTQVLNYGKVKNHFYSPVKQNERHCTYISRIINQAAPVYSAVLFVSGDISGVNSDYVYTPFELKRMLKTFISSNQLSDGEVKRIYDVLCENNKSSMISNEEHTENVRKTKDDIANGICPRCRGNLVLRNGKYGDFWGCSNYPKCTFTMRV